MSEKQQQTSVRMREKMQNRYGDDLHHKHNKCHSSYRLHCRSHPAHLFMELNENKGLNESTGLLRMIKLRKIRKRLDKGHIH